MAKKVPSEQLSLLELLLLGTPAVQSDPGSVLTSVPVVEATLEGILDGSGSDHTTEPLTSVDAPVSDAGLSASEQQARPEARHIPAAGERDGDVAPTEQSPNETSVEGAMPADVALPGQGGEGSSENKPEAEVDRGVEAEFRRDLAAELLDHGAAGELSALDTEETRRIKSVLSEAAKLLLAGNGSGDLYDIAVRVAVRDYPRGELLRLMGKAGVNRLSLLAAWPEGLPVTAQGRAADLYQEWVATRADGAVAAIRPGYWRDRAGGLMPHPDLACVAWMLPEDRYVRTVNIMYQRVVECKRQFLTRGLASSTEGYPIYREVISLLQEWSNGRAYREIFGSWRVDASGRIVFFVDGRAKNYMARRGPEFAGRMQRLGYWCKAEEERILMIPTNGTNGVTETPK